MIPSDAEMVDGPVFCLLFNLAIERFLSFVFLFLMRFPLPLRCLSLRIFE
jgi:hypothetical protein